MNKMQSCFQFVSKCPSSFFRETSSTSASYLRPFMAKLQCRVIQNYSALSLPSCSPFGSSQTFRLCSQARLKKPTVSSMIPGCLSAVHSSLRHGCFILPTPALNTTSPWSLNSHECLAIAKRHFSHVSRPKKQGKNFGGFGKCGKQLSGRDNEKATSNFAISASKEANASKRKNVGDVKLESSVPKSPPSSNHGTSKVNRRKKQQTRTKTEKEQPSSIIADEASETKSPIDVIKKKSVAKKSKQSVKRENPNGNVTSLKTIGESVEGQKLHAVGKPKPSSQETSKQLYPPNGKSVVVVESVTKSKVIQGYLGNMFEVLPSYGHVRDLAARSGSVRPEDDFSMVWEVPSAAWTHLKSIKVALTGAENLILASDPDREGEAIAWHIIEMLQQQDALNPGISVARVVFHEVTEESIKNALQAPREIDLNLVNAYLARRALDYLIGFNISPLLWRKLPGCQSAGRVQSAALSLICDRETEIDEFKPQEYWTIAVGLFIKDTSSLVNTHLTQFDSNKLSQHSISSHTQAKHIEQKINVSSFHVSGAKESKMRRNPPTPLITSTLQQDAANKLHFSSIYTMKLAQKLYEGVHLSDGKATGLITYIRTDGLNISDEAVSEIRSLVIERYGQDFASKSPRKYFKKVKNAQEAHEAIRPTNIRLLPSMLVNVLDEDSLKLYSLIWSRTVACQMEPSTIEQIQVDIGNADESITLRASCSKVGFPGYQAVYEDIEAGAVRYKENDVHERQETFGILKSLKRREPLNLGEVKLEQHFTQPPPRYSEGSLVKKMEELGIGRPSTYASTLRVLQDRKYVTTKSRVLYPEFRGRMVSAFLSHYFTEVTDYSFTADMETELDNVSAGLTEWKGLLRDYWTRFSSYCKQAESVHIHQVEKMLGKKFEDFLFGSLPDDKNTCPSCLEGNLIFKVSRYGAGYFIGCDQHPKCKYIAKTLFGDDEEEETPQNKSVEEPKLLGVHPVSNEKILLKNGPYGSYVQLGEDRKGYTPKRASVSHIKDVDSITLEDALEQLRYPVTLGNHPKDGHPVILRFAKAGLAVKHRRTIASVPKNMKPDDITVEKALDLLSSNNVRRSGRPKKVVEEVAEAL